jgi:hypothetical protein
MQPILHKQHQMFMEQKQKKQGGKRKKGSVEEDTPPFDPEYPYHPRRKTPMQPSPTKDSGSQQQTEHSAPPILLEQETKPKSLNFKDVSEVKELLEEYDLSTSIEGAASNYDQPQAAIETPKRDEREHRPSPDEKQLRNLEIKSLCID